MKNREESAQKQNVTPSKNKENRLEWGAHNPKLSPDNFIDKRPKKISDQNELLANVNGSISSKKQK